RDARLGLDAWSGFVDNSRKHLGTPLTNNMGLKTVLAYEEATRAIHTRDYSLEDPFDVWKTARRRVFDERSWLFALLVLGYAALLARAASKQEDWAALALGVGMIPVATELTCYYYSFLLLFGVLWRRREPVGVGLLALAALTCAVTGIWYWIDDQYV